MKWNFRLIRKAVLYKSIGERCTLFRLTILTHPSRLQLHYSYVALNSKFKKVAWICEFELGGLHCTLCMSDLILMNVGTLV